MIQISPPINTSGSTGESGAAKQPEQASLKKDKLGVFARLLDGLVGKKKASAGPGAPTEGLEEESLKSLGKPNPRDRKKNTPSLGGLPEELSGAAGAGLSRLTLVRGPGVPGEDGAGEPAAAAAENSRGRGKAPLKRESAAAPSAQEASRKQEGAEVQQLLDPDLSPSLEPKVLGEAAEARDLPGETPDRSPGSGEPKAPERESPARGLVDLPPYAGRNEKEAFQFAGIKRTGFSGAEKDDRETSRLSESRNSKRNRERLSLQVQDLRSGETAVTGVSGETQELNRAAPAAAGREVDLSVTLHPGSREPEERSNAGTISAPGRAFEDLLARELHQNLNGDIVRHASIILKDGGEGSIRLSLKPETLGNIKIRLEMAENKITGHIVVESGEALRAFEREIRSLEQAFRESGFENATLDMSLASGNGGENGGQRPGGEAGNPYSERLAASLYDTATETAGLSGGGSLSPAGAGRESVNMLV